MTLRDEIKKLSIDLDQYEILKNIDNHIALNLEMIEKLKLMKEALFLQKLTNEEKIFIVENKIEKFYLNEENYLKVRSRVENFTSHFSCQKFDLAKFRLKKLEI